MTRAEISEYTYAALRIVAGALFMCHGLAKLVGWPMDQTHGLDLQMHIGGVIELVAGGLIAVGLFTRIAAFIAAGQMAVAYFQFHWKLHFADSMWSPMVNHGEDAVLFCFIFLAIFGAGPGRFSIDQRRGAT